MKKFTSLLWSTTIGAFLAFCYLVFGAVLAATVVCMPLAKESFKMAKYFLTLPENLKKTQSPVFA